MKKLILMSIIIFTIYGNIFSQLAEEMTPALLAELDSIPDLILTPASENTTLPYKVNNAVYIWMPDIFNQQGNSCAQSAGIGYTFPRSRKFATCEELASTKTFLFLCNFIEKSQY